MIWRLRVLWLTMAASALMRPRTLMAGFWSGSSSSLAFSSLAGSLGSFLAGSLAWSFAGSLVGCLSTSWIGVIASAKDEVCVVAVPVDQALGDFAVLTVGVPSTARAGGVGFSSHGAATKGNASSCFDSAEQPASAGALASAMHHTIARAHDRITHDLL